MKKLYRKLCKLIMVILLAPNDLVIGYIPKEFYDEGDEWSNMSETWGVK